MHEHEYLFYYLITACSFGVDVVGRMAASWNLPVITAVGSSGNLGNKLNFPTLTRLSFGLNKFAQMYLNIFEKYNWTDVAIIHDVTRPIFQIVGDSLLSEFSKVEKNVKRIPFNITNDDVATILYLASRRSRGNYVEI